MVDYREEFYSARWHLDVAKRMLGVYEEYAEKRVLVGVIREGAKAAGKLVRAFLIREGMKGDLKVFVREVAPRYLDAGVIENVVKILEIERAQRMARVEFVKGDNILLEADGEWKVLKVERLKEFINSIDDIICNFPTDIKR